MTESGFTVKVVPAEALWSQAPGDATAETIIDETAWEGAAQGPGWAPAILAEWLRQGAWVVGLYEGDELIGLFDVGRFVPHDYLLSGATGVGALGVDSTPERPLKHLTLWFAIRPAARGRVPAPVFKALADAFLRHLWNLGIRELITVHILNLAEGRDHAASVERLGWRTLARRGLVEIKGKTLLERP